MKMLRYFMIFCLLTLGNLVANSQKSILTIDSLISSEKLLKSLGDSIINGSTDFSRNGAAAEFNPRFFDLLANPETFNYPFDSIKTVSILKSPDGLMRIYTWIVPSRIEGTFKYYGVVQRINIKTGEMKLIGLVELKSIPEEAELAELKYDTWFGAIYYEIIEKNIGKNKYYFLLGWQGNDRLTTRKLIDVIYFDSWNNLTFGAPVFKDETKKLKQRVIFEYTTEAVMLLRYEKKKKMIVFDHLSPSSPSLKGQYRYYGPDFTYDAYHFKKGFWNYRKNLEMRNSNDSK
ncbi:MAG: hypothetical protein IPP71_14245 [Bacteroidetes bacterium]|nr:hypothetical protein [Bacteroidota bacterium]